MPDALQSILSVLKKNKLLCFLCSKAFSFVNKHLFWTSIAIYIIPAAIVFGIMGWTGKDPNFGYPQLSPIENGIALVGHTYRLDTDSFSASIKWEIMGCGTYQLPTPSTIFNLPGCGILDRAVDIYLNRAPDPVYSYDPTDFPLNSWGEIQYVYKLTFFPVEHLLDEYDEYMAPFDAFYLNVFAFAIEKATNWSIPIVTLTNGDVPNGFAVYFTEQRLWSNYTYNPGTGPITIEAQASMAYIEARRSQPVQALTMCLLIINWALTISSVYITLVVVFGREVKSDTIPLLPVTNILTIPTLRNLYGGSPPFGIFIDTFGFFLQIMLIAVCSMVLVYWVTIRSAR